VSVLAKQAVELMFGAYRRELLAQLLLRPDEDFHLRELERMTAIQREAFFFYWNRDELLFCRLTPLQNDDIPDKFL